MQRKKILLLSLVVAAILALTTFTSWLNTRYPCLTNGGSLADTPLSKGVALTGWQQVGTGVWQFRFDAPDASDMVLCIADRTRSTTPEGLEPLDAYGEFYTLSPAARTITLTLNSPAVPRTWLVASTSAWHWINLRSYLQIIALVAFATMGIAVLALFCFKPRYELGYFLLFIAVLFGWGLTVFLVPSSTSTLHELLLRFYFAFAVLVPVWLCGALTHTTASFMKYPLSLVWAGVFLAMSFAQNRFLRYPALLGGMLLALYLLVDAIVRGRRSAWYLLVSYSITVSFRLLVLLPPLSVPFYIESLPFYTLRCARIYDLPFALGCLVFVCRHFALQFVRTEQLARELDARVARRTKALQEETDARKSMMLNIFHDLRSPLFAVSSGLETLADTPEALPTLLPVLQQRVDFVRGLTEDLFLAAKLEQKQVMLNEEPVFLQQAAAAVCSACQPEADQKGVHLLADTSTALPVWGDSRRLQQILQNLVTNAIHYTPSGGSITVRCAAEAGQALVSVTDTGCGIAPGDQAAVFQRYFHTTASPKHDSTGLGLTIAQELAHLHHGEITLASTPGEGSCFTLRLPLLET